MKLKDLTKEQAIEIAILAYRGKGLIRSEITFNYYPFIPSDTKRGIYKDMEEFIAINFDAYTIGEQIESIKIRIYSNLNIDMHIFKCNGGFPEIIPLSVSNQFLIFKKLQEWGFDLD